MEPSYQRAPTNATAHPAAFAVLLLAPAASQLLTAELPPTVFFHPLTLLLNVQLAGCGCLVCHELAMRWRRGWPTLLTLAAALALVAEGVARGSLGSGNWVDLGPLAHYGRVFGLNWILLVAMLLHYTMLVVLVPILTAELIWPEARGRPWLDSAGFSLAAFGLGAVLLGTALELRQPGPWRTALWLGAAAGLLVWRAARWRPGPLWRPRALAPWRVCLAAALVELAALTLTALMPGTGAPATPVFVVAALVLWAVAYQTARRVAGGWSDAHSTGLLLGIVGPLAVLAVLAELDPARLDDPSGMAVVGLLALTGVAALGLRAGKRRRHASAQSESPPS